MRRDNWAEWLPEALADLLAGIASIGGSVISRNAILASWGIMVEERSVLSDDEEADMRARQWSVYLGKIKNGSSK